MKAAFEIRDPNLVLNDPELFLQISQHSFTYLIIDQEQVAALAEYHFPETETALSAAATLKKIISGQPLLDRVFRKINLVYDLPLSVFVPQEFFNSASKRNVLELVYGDVSDLQINNDFMYRQNQQNVYGIPSELHDVVRYLFQSDEIRHFYSLLPYISTGAGDFMTVVFHPHRITYMLVKDGAPLFVREHRYQSPDDVCYHLLKAATSFQLEPDVLELRIHGLIDVKSNLLNELSKYFQRIRPMGLPDHLRYPESVQAFPAHYFSHYFYLNICV